MDDQEIEEKVSHQASPNLFSVTNTQLRNREMMSIAGLAWNFC